MKMEEQGFGAGVDLEGIKIAQVISNIDEKAQGRVLVRVIGVHDLRTIEENEEAVKNWGVWAHCCSPTRSGPDIPEIGDYVYVMFPNTQDPMYIIWLGFVQGTFQTPKKDITKNSGNKYKTTKYKKTSVSTEGL